MHLHELPVCHLCCLTFIFNLMCTTRLNNHFHLAVALKRQRQAGEGKPRAPEPHSPIRTLDDCDRDSADGDGPAQAFIFQEFPRQHNTTA